MKPQKTRKETDSIGSVEIPAEALYGIQTARALENFPITGVALSHFPTLVIALAQVKWAAADTNGKLKVLSPERTKAIIEACEEIVAGKHHEHFQVDMIQGGAGTSSNMNANEVIANIGLKKLGHKLGDYEQLHPNDHVNLGQSTNDVYPTALRLSILALVEPLCAEMTALKESFEERGEAFSGIVKVGRTQLQDAVPMTLGQEFSSFADTIAADISRMREASKLLMEVNLGGTAIGTGINAPEHYDCNAVATLSKLSGFALSQASNLVEASSDLGELVTFSGILRRVAVKLSKICNDLRLLSSGPRAGLGEIILPPVQAGSSIMPGKVNPVIPEVVNQVCFQVIGNDLVVTMAAEAGQLQLNAMEPVVIYNILGSIQMLSNALKVLREKCVIGIEADKKRAAELLENSLIFTTALVPHIGYDKAASLAKQALKEGRNIREVVLEHKIMSAEELDKIFEEASSKTESPSFCLILD